MYVLNYLLFIHVVTKSCFFFTLFVTVPPTLYINQLPTKQTKTENETVSYSCRTEAKPAATILWQLNGENLTETPPYNYSVSFAPILQSKLLKTLSYLTINRVTWRQHGNFSCLVYNDAGEKSQATELEVRCECRPILFCNTVCNVYNCRTSCCQF